MVKRLDHWLCKHEVVDWNPRQRPLATLGRAFSHDCFCASSE